MPRYSVGVRTGTGSATLPAISLYAGESVGGRLVEIGISVTAATGHSYELRRLTTAGTPGAGLTEAKHDPDSIAASCTAFTTHTVGPTLGDVIRRVPSGNNVGQGWIWNFPYGLEIEPGTDNGLGLIVIVGTGATSEAYLVWDEL